MSKNIFIISDTHFSHINILKFCRPQFESPDQMNEIIIDKWNHKVKPDDMVYHVGDVAFGGGKSVTERLDSILPRLHGTKRLCLGNHDHKIDILMKHFEKIGSSFELTIGGRELFLCHYPLHFSSGDNHMGEGTLNVHGHIHQHLTSNPRHVNVCVEHTNFEPVAAEDIASGKYRTN